MPRKRQGVSLIQGLPVELLSSIFYWASYIESSGTIQRTPSRGIASNHAPLTLFKVCQRWRSIALNTPALFTQLYILEKFPVDIATIVPLWLERSKSLPLKIWLNLQDVKHNYKPRGFDNIILQLRKHLDRIIFFTSSFSYHLSLLFPANETICLPALQHLEIASIGKRHERTYIGFVSAPCLTTAVLGSQSIGLSQLHLGGQLTRFLCHREATLTCMQFYALLAHNPKLVECSVITVERMRSLAADSAKITETYPTLELPNLTNLSISWIINVDYLSSIINRLRAPRLQSLQLKPKGCLLDQISSQKLFKAVKVSLCACETGKFTKLYIGFGSAGLTNTVPLSDMLSSIPTLKDLTFQGVSFGRMEDLLSDPKTLPLLEKLQFHQCLLDLEDTLSMVKSRASIREGEAYQSLKEFSATNVSWVENGRDVDRDIGLDRLCGELAISCPNIEVIVS